MNDKSTMRMNGIMIDCSRLMERHEYYFRLIDFMAEWGMNTLVLHFADDFGLGVVLPEFKELAMPNAFTPRDIKKLVAHARRNGIDVIPELEVFGHTRFLTDHPAYEHLFLGRKTKRLKFCAVDPFNPETQKVMQRLIKATARLFPSRYMHLGCDEVDMGNAARQQDVDEATAWTDYVNAMIQIARRCGKRPMIWGDHPSNDRKIAKLLRKDVILIDWRYREDIKDNVITRLERAGFKQFLVAPSLACYRHRFLPNEIALQNTSRQAQFGTKHGVLGMINTIWCPWRHLQNAMYYGIAFSACAVREGGTVNRFKFHKEFARRTFGTILTPELSRFLDAWPKLTITHDEADKLVSKNAVFTDEERKRIKQVNTEGGHILPIAQAYSPAKNEDIWHGMVLAAEAAWLCSESVMLTGKATAERRQAYNDLLKRVRWELDEEWDRTRYADDPQKYKTKFPGDNSAYAMIVMKRLPSFKV